MPREKFERPELMKHLLRNENQLSWIWKQGRFRGQLVKWDKEKLNLGDVIITDDSI